MASHLKSEKAKNELKQTRLVPGILGEDGKPLLQEGPYKNDSLPRHIYGTQVRKKY